MLSFGCGLQQVCPKSLVLPCLDLTRLLELLLDLQLLRLRSEWIKGKWGRGGGEEEEEEEQRGERKKRRKETEAETGRGRETENMLDRGGHQDKIAHQNNYEGLT